MPSFADSFWTPDFSTGIEVLFQKLNQGCIENQEFIDLFTSRMEYEDDYGKKLLSLPQFHSPSKTGFDRDDGATLKNSFKGVAQEMSTEGEHHIQIATNIKEQVMEPFTKWSHEHKQRINYSDQILKNSLKVYKNKARLVEKIQRKYFTKCRLLESLKQGLTEEEIIKELSLSDTTSEITKDGDVEEDEDDNDNESIILGGVEYNKSGLKELFQKLLTEINKTSLKVPILGTYEHVSTGTTIVTWLQENLGISNIDKAESFGKDLLNNGYLKKVNTSVGSTIASGGSIFVNSGSFHYQWKDTAFHIAGVSPQKPNSDNGSLSNESETTSSRKVSSYIDDLKSSFEEPTLKKVNKEVNELDEDYKIEIKKLDKIRCDLEELIVDHLNFMEKCELDRLKALKKVILDFSASISNTITSLKSSIDKILVYEETISPEKDLLFLLQNYRTGCFSPKVILYDNYYNSFKDQIFGVTLEARCKNDNKTVPLVISSILSYMDSIYPDLPDDEVRTKIWLVPVRLQSTHQLRNEIESIGSDNLNHEFYSKFEPETVASVLKLYLLELPDSIVSSDLYDLIKSIYNQFGSKIKTNERIIGLTNVLKNLDRPNFAILNSLCTHFQRLISILKENKDSNIAKTFQVGISQEFSNCILRPKQQSNISLSDKHVFRFLNDLLENKDEIFKSLKNNLKNNLKKVNGTDSIKRNNSTLQKKLENAVKKGSRKVSDPSTIIEISDHET